MSQQIPPVALPVPVRAAPAPPVYVPVSNPLLRGRRPVPNSLALFQKLQAQGRLSSPPPTLVQAPGVFGNAPHPNYSIYNTAAATLVQPPGVFSNPSRPNYSIYGNNEGFSSGPSLSPIPSVAPRRTFAFPRPPSRQNNNFNVENVSGLNLSGERGGSKRSRRRYKKNKRTRRFRK